MLRIAFSIFLSAVFSVCVAQTGVFLLVMYPPVNEFVSATNEISFQCTLLRLHLSGQERLARMSKQSP